jgi:hypothetical protein
MILVAKVIEENDCGAEEGPAVINAVGATMLGAGDAGMLDANALERKLLLMESVEPSSGAVSE